MGLNDKVTYKFHEYEPAGNIVELEITGDYDDFNCSRLHDFCKRFAIAVGYQPETVERIFWCNSLGGYSIMDEWLEDDIEEEYPTSRAAERRKNDWKHTLRTAAIAHRRYDNDDSLDGKKHQRKPLHYYAKNPPWNGYAYAPHKTNNKASRRYISKNYAPVKNWKEHDQRQIDNFENQMNELFDSD